MPQDNIISAFYFQISSTDKTPLPVEIAVSEVVELLSETPHSWVDVPHPARCQG